MHLLAVVVLLDAHARVWAKEERDVFELEVRLEGHESSCRFLSLRSTQQHRGLNVESSITSSQSDLLEDSNGLVALSTESGGLPDASWTDASQHRRYFSYDRMSLINQAQQLCGPREKWDFPIFLDQASEDAAISELHRPDAFSEVLSGSRQTLLADTIAKPPHVPAPELDIVPLTTSGPSDNRVDLVFFGDGCK